MEKRIASLLVEKNIWLFLASICFIAFSLLKINTLSLDADPRLYFSDQHTHFVSLKKLEEKYGREQQVLLAIEFADTIYQKDNLALIETITKEAWTLPHVKRVDSLANYAYSWSENDELFVEHLIEGADNFTNDDIKRIEEIATTDPAIVRRLVSLSAPIVMIRLDVIVSDDHKEREKQEAELTKATQQLITEYQQQTSDVRFLLSGSVVSNTVTNSLAIDEATRLVPLMYSAIFLLLIFLLRSVSAVVGIIFVTAFSCLCAMGLAAHLNFVLNLMSITCVNIIVTVSIAHCVHICMYFLQAYRNGDDKRTALIESYRINLQPIFLTSVTTALGFLSMNFSDMPPAHDLGNITACGVMVALFLSLTLLPSIILWLPIRRSKNTSKKAKKDDQIMGHFAQWVIKHRHKVGISSIIISGIFLACVPINVVNDQFAENVKPPHQFRLDNDHIDKHFGGLYTIEFDLNAKPGSTIADPEYLAALDKFVLWLREQENIRNVYSYSDIIKRLNRNMHGDDPEFYRIPSNQKEAAQYLLLYELSQPFGSDISNIIQPNKESSRVIVNIPSFDSKDVIALREKIRIWSENNMPSYMHYPGESLAVMWMYLGAEGFYSSVKGALIALFIISIILTFVFKSVRYGAISLIPNLLPAGIGYGVWAMISGNLDMSQMMVLSITIGIVVDDTVHFLSKYMRARKESNASSEDAVRYAFKHVGAPLWITTLVLVAGFLLLATSSFQPNTNLGVLTAIILVSALALDFFLLPALLMWLDSKKDSKAQQA